MINSPLKATLKRQVITPFFYFSLESVEGEPAFIMITKAKKRQRPRVSVSPTLNASNQGTNWLVTMQLSKLDCELLFRLKPDTVVTFKWSSVVMESNCGAFEAGSPEFEF